MPGRGLSALTLLCGLLCALYGAAALLDLAARDERRTVRPLGAGSSVAVALGTGGIDVRAGSGPARIEVQETRGLFGGPGVSVGRTDAGTIEVDTDCPWISLFSCSASVRLVVPAQTAVRLETGSGDVTVAGVRGDTWVDTGSGSVTVSDVRAGRLRAETGSGDVRVRRAASEAVALDTGSGTIDVGLTRPPREVVAESGSGDLTLTVPDAGYRIETETGSGDEDVRVRRDPGAERSLSLQTGSGDLTVLPAG